MSEFIIREGKKADLPSVFDLVKELAIYEKAEDQVTNTVKMMEEGTLVPSANFQCDQTYCR